jgi:hypothetical protein
VCTRVVHKKRRLLSVVGYFAGNGDKPRSNLICWGAKLFVRFSGEVWSEETDDEKGS